MPFSKSNLYRNTFKGEEINGRIYSQKILKGLTTPAL